MKYPSMRPAGKNKLQAILFDLDNTLILFDETEFFEYYLEICRKIQIQPENCLMVGNDPVNDMIAGKTGMQTFLTVDGSSLALSQRFTKAVTSETPVGDYQGSLSELAAVVNSII